MVAMSTIHMPSGAILRLAVRDLLISLGDHCSGARPPWVSLGDSTARCLDLTGGLTCPQGCFSYPFFDPVLTDRAFLAKPSTMLGAFILGGFVAAIFIFFFGFVGIYGSAVATLRPEW